MNEGAFERSQGEANRSLLPGAEDAEVANPPVTLRIASNAKPPTRRAAPGCGAQKIPVALGE